MTQALRLTREVLFYTLLLDYYRYIGGKQN